MDSVFYSFNTRELLTRIMDILLVRYSMKYVMHVRNKVHHYGLGNLYNALDRPEGVGLLTVCNHVTTLDSASIIPSMIPICTLYLQNPIIHD